jgi:hypothetical protein
MRTSQKILKLSRKIHLYIGVFIAPALLFFSFTGAVQTFSLHETTQGSSYSPPKWLVVLGQLHKKQTTDLPARKHRPPSADLQDHSQPDGRTELAQNPAAPRKAADSPAPAAKRHLPMKIFFLLVAVGLALSTLTGIIMAWRYGRPPMVIALLAAGVAVPCLLLIF